MQTRAIVCPLLVSLCGVCVCVCVCVVGLKDLATNPQGHINWRLGCLAKQRAAFGNNQSFLG
jgi:hypothetical protein